MSWELSEIMARWAEEDRLRQWIADEVRRQQVEAQSPLEAKINEAEQLPDPKLRKMYEAVIRYKWYLEELRALKVATKKHQTSESLKKHFLELEVWAVLDKHDEQDVAEGNFYPGRFAWSLVKRQNRLKGKDDRTLKAYRRALRAAGVSF
jgi:hypothetical protein